MDHCHLMANYSFDHYSSEFSYESGHRINQQNLHTESGYESLLATSANSSNFFPNSNSNDSSLFSLPTTPVKKSAKFIFNGNNCSTTPDFKQQYVADVSGYYFKSIRSSYDSSPSSDQYSVSQSPKSNTGSYCASIDSYVTKRDNITSKLLRSPAFKLENHFSPNNNLAYQPIERPSIKSFSSRFTSELPKFEEKKPTPVVKPTPTETEFMELLISNHHLPGNPEFLIGRNMGVDNVNILGELNKRSMNNVLDKIFSYMNVGDLVRVGCVSKEWRTIVKENPKLNKDRVRFIRSRRFIYETTKENHGKSPLLQSYDIEGKRKLSDMSLLEKRKMYKSSNICGSNVTHENVFTSLDVNCLNNYQRSVDQPKRLLENQFRCFSISDEIIFTMSPTKRSPIKRSPIKRSPLKRQSPVKSSNTSTTLICSKKSKKNLKRL